MEPNYLVILLLRLQYDRPHHYVYVKHQENNESFNSGITNKLTPDFHANVTKSTVLCVTTISMLLATDRNSSSSHLYSSVSICNGTHLELQKSSHIGLP